MGVMNVRKAYGNLEKSVIEIFIYFFAQSYVSKEKALVVPPALMAPENRRCLLQPLPNRRILCKFLSGRVWHGVTHVSV